MYENYIMKTVKYSLLVFALCLSVTACKSNSSGDATGTDTLSNTTATPDNMNGTTDMSNGNADANMNGNSTGGSEGTTNMNNTAARPSGESDVTGAAASKTIKKRDSAGFAESGQYNSDVATPKPKNLDDKKYRDNPPNHSYGDTSPKARPQR